MTGQRERNVVFGEAVEQYEATRPDYPAQLPVDVLAYAGPGPVLEVGAGTGKATAGFAGVADLTCIEPDPRMAEALARNCPRARVVVSRFEDWPPDRGYGLLYSAQAWHWVDPDRRNDLAHAALAPGGALALFWNISGLVDPVLHAALAVVDERHGLSDSHTPHSHRAEEFAADIPADFDAEWASLGLGADGRFTELTSRRYRRRRTYPTALYLDLLRSISLYRMLEPDRREALLGDVAAVIDEGGGVVELAVVTDLALARRAT